MSQEVAGSSPSLPLGIMARSPIPFGGEGWGEGPIAAQTCPGLPLTSTATAMSGRCVGLPYP